MNTLFLKSRRALLAATLCLTVGLTLQPQRAEALIPTTDWGKFFLEIGRLVIKLIDLYESVNNTIETMDQTIADAKSITTIQQDTVDSFNKLTEDISTNATKIVDEAGHVIETAPDTLNAALEGYASWEIGDLYAMGEGFSTNFKSKTQDAMNYVLPATLDEIEYQVRKYDAENPLPEMEQVQRKQTGFYTVVEGVEKFVGGMQAQAAAARDALAEINSSIAVQASSATSEDGEQTVDGAGEEIQVLQGAATLSAMEAAAMMNISAALRQRLTLQMNADYSSLTAVNDQRAEQLARQQNVSAATYPAYCNDYSTGKLVAC